MSRDTRALISLLSLVGLVFLLIHIGARIGASHEAATCVKEVETHD